MEKIQLVGGEVGGKEELQVKFNFPTIGYFVFCCGFFSV